MIAGVKARSGLAVIIKSGQLYYFYCVVEKGGRAVGSDADVESDRGEISKEQLM